MLALPITFGQLAQTANGFIDTVMAGQVSPLDLAAAALGSSMWIPVFLFISGVLIATTAMLAPLFGAGAHESIPKTMHQALWLALILSVVSLIAVKFSPLLFQWMDVSTELAALTVIYLDGISWGMPGMCLFIALRAFSDAIGHTKPMMLISMVGLLCNIPLNYIFIYGKFGLPAMGGAGCGWSTAVIMWLMAALMAAHIFTSARFKPFPIFSSFTPPNFSTITKLLQLGLPIGLAIFFEISIFSAVALLISTLGPIPLAGHQIASNFSMLMFMIPLSVAMSLTIRVGQFRGMKNMAAVRFTIKVGLLLVITLTSIMSILLILLRSYIGSIYSDDKTVIEIAAALLVFAAIYQVSDGLQVGAAGALRGFKDTTIPMLLTLIAYWGVGFPTAYLFGSTSIFVPPMGASGYWLGLVTGLTAAAILLNARLFYVIKVERKSLK